MATSGKFIALQNALFTRCCCVGRTDCRSFQSMNDCLHLVVACSEQAQRKSGFLTHLHTPVCFCSFFLHRLAQCVLDTFLFVER